MRIDLGGAGIKRNPRIIYWSTACLEPGIEAVSKEVFLLARHFRPSMIFSVSPHLRVRFSSTDRCIGFHPKFYPLLRLLVPALERWSDIGHVYGDVSPWLYHKSLRKKPIVHTIASEKGLPVLPFLERCAAITVQTEEMQGRLADRPMLKEKTEVLYPGVDLSYFHPDLRPPPLNTVKLLFASAPRTAGELEGRGVPLLIEAARRDPHLEVHLLFRPWVSGYTSLETARRLLHERCPAGNAEVESRTIEDMAHLYRSHHFTVIPYTTADGGKECPNSAIESLACGVPVIASKASPFSRFIARHECGIVHAPTPEGLCRAVASGLDRYGLLRENARNIALRFFSKEKMMNRFETIYRTIMRV